MKKETKEKGNKGERGGGGRRVHVPVYLSVCVSICTAFTLAGLSISLSCARARGPIFGSLLLPFLHLGRVCVLAVPVLAVSATWQSLRLVYVDRSVGGGPSGGAVLDGGGCVHR